MSEAIKNKFLSPGENDYLVGIQQDIQNGRSNEFDRTLLAMYEMPENASYPLRECWEKLEGHYAQTNGVRPRPYPFQD